jgi:hypothetical protein
LSGITHTTVITVNYSTNKTTYQYDGGTPVEYSGVPDGVGDEGTLIYANDDIKSLSGTVQRDTKITVSSEYDICITDDVVYQDHYDAGAAGILIPAAGFAPRDITICWVYCRGAEMCV